jgi:hypothetical protein
MVNFAHENIHTVVGQGLTVILLSCLCGFGGHFKVKKAVFWHRLYLYAVFGLI